MNKTFGIGLALTIFTVLAACGGGDDDSSGPGAAGEGGGGGSSACPTDGKGTVSITVNLPSGVDADVVVTPAGASPVAVTESTELDLDSGDVTVVARRVVDDDPIVKTVFDPVVRSGSFCLGDGMTHEVTVDYAAIPSSNKLWTSNLRGFASSQLEATDSIDPSVVGDAPVGKDVAFDRDGNLWSMGATLAETMLVRLPADDLGSSGTKSFDREINVPEIDCIPALKAMAFDGSGNLWLAGCGGRLLRLPSSALARSGDAASSAALASDDDPEDLAFDAAGNLWAAAGGKILRFDADHLSDATAPDLTLTARNAGDSADLGATGLAFDASGNLWGFDFGGNVIFEVSAADLDGSGDESVVSEVSFVVGVLTLLDRGAFDEGGGLWISYSSTAIGRFAPDQLTESSDPGSPVTPAMVVTSTELDSELRVALFPAPAGVPLYHTAFPPR